MKVIDLLNKIANGEIEDKRTFIIDFKNGLQRSIYYDKDENNCMCCLKNVSDDYSIYDDISFDTEIATKDTKIATIEEKKIPEKLKVHGFGDKDENGNYVMSAFPTNEELMNKINEIIDYLKSKGE